MKFHWGAIPEDTGFDPAAEGWTPIREPNPVLLQVIAIPVAFGAVGVLVGLLYWIWPSDTLYTGSITPQPSNDGSVTFTLSLGSIWLTLALLIGFIPAHELLHAICFPGGLSSPRTMLGVWPSRFLFYAHYNGAMSRNRFLLVFIVPFLGLSVLPVALIGLTGIPSVEFALLALVNGAAASGDLIGFFLILGQIPGSALVRNQGWRSYWRPSTIEAHPS